MRIVMLLSNGFAPDPRVAAEATALHEAGHQVTIFAWDRSGKLAASEDYSGVCVVRCPIQTTYSKGPLQIFKFRQFWKECRRFLTLQRPEAVHCHDLDTLQPGIQYGRKHYVPVIFDAHESYPDMVAHLFPGPVVRLIRRMEAHLVPQATAVITVGNVLAAHFREMQVRATQIRTTQVGPAQDLGVVVVGNYKNLAGSTGEVTAASPPLQITYVGGLNRDRLLAPLIEAIRGEKRFQCRIVGDGPERTGLEQLAGQAANIHFTGYLPPEEAQTVIAGSHLVYYAIDPAYPNNRYSAPNSLFLALAAGKPLVVTPVGEVAQIVREENCGTVLEDLRPETIRSGLAQYLDRELWERQAGNSMKAARQKYNWDCARKNLADLYRQIEDKPQKLILINHYASIPRWPGPTRNFDFAAALVQKDWKVALFSCRFNHYLRRYLSDPPCEEDGVTLRWIWSTPYSGNSLLRELNILAFSFFSVWAGLFTPGDIILTVTPPLESAFMAWLLARVKGIPFVLDVEDLWPDSIVAMGFRNKPVIAWLSWLESFLYRHSDYFLVVAAAMKEHLIKKGVPDDKIDIIPLGANAPRFTTPRETVRAKYGWPDGQIIAVYVGAHGPANALETLIKAARELPGDSQIKIVLFGDGSDKPRLQELAAGLGLDNLVLEDPVPPEQVPDILRAADIGIASLKNVATFETVRPNKLYEYMAVGLPVVCCIAGEAQRFIKESGSGITVVPEDYRGLADALLKLAQDPELRRELSAKGQAFFASRGKRQNLAAAMGASLRRVIIAADRHP